ncbi:MAG: response regulator [Janthinobacterium lividum]
MTGPRVLIVDDERQIRRLLRTTLERAGHLVAEAESAAEALRVVVAERPALVLLDLGLPDRDGLELIPLLRAKSKAAILVVSAREDTDQKVAALDLGADDYVTKPFDTEELLARVRTTLRRQSRNDAGEEKVVAGALAIDLVDHRVVRAGVDVHLTQKEFAVLAELARHPGRVVTHAALLRTVWGPAFLDNVEYLRVVMRNLRQKLEDEPARPALLVNELGVGYRLMRGEAPPGPA